MQYRIGALWPAVRAGFPWQWLVDPLDTEGPARFDRQFWRANVDPSERCVLSVTGSSALRLASDASGLPNLFLAGDWLRTGLDCGCVEAAVMGGMQASRTLSGSPRSSWATATSGSAALLRTDPACRSVARRLPAAEFHNASRITRRA